VKPYLFSIARWELRAIPDELNQWIFGREEKIDDEIGVVTEYFSATKRINTLKSEIEAANTGDGESDLASLEAELNRLQERKMALEDTVERIIEKQITETLAQQGIFNPIDKYIRLKVNFPPVNFELEKPPHLLVISPRDRIESMREITLRQNISLEEIEDIESKVDKLGVSSLVVELGGCATYPSFITNDASLRFTIDTAIEEWLHQYLALKPLGFLYLLDLTGLSRNYEIATMNETLAGMVSREIGSIIYEKYYSEYESSTNQNQAPESEFDFNREMREIRKTVDIYLARGEIERADGFMEQKRQYLASKGYYIRKLNQAYFAFHGTYADRPTSISPIGLELKKLRGQSASLKDFLNTVAAMSSHQDLTAALNETQQK
jgi:predicted  nucleic acid-binding Zn-ribbon protein